jgi:hypothetical protein
MKSDVVQGLLLVLACMFKWNEEILGFAKRAKEAQDAKQCEKQQQAKDLHDSLLQKVEVIRTKKPPEKWTSAELNTMLQWYKCPNDSAMPPKKCDKLARYQEICGRADPQPPQLQNEPTTASLLLPPLSLAQEEEQHGLTSPKAKCSHCYRRAINTGCWWWGPDCHRHC